MAEEKKEDKESIFDESVEDASEVSEEEHFKEEGQEIADPTEVDIKVDIGEKDADVYTEEGRDELMENEEIEPWEEGFVEGAEGEEQKGIKGDCPTCKKPLGDRDEGVIEKMVDGEILYFCCEECAEEYESKIPPEERGE